jgi:hypothetical protein
MRLIIVGAMILLFFGCAATQECICPAEDAYIHDAEGNWLMIETGGLEDPVTDYYNEEEYQELYQEYLKKMKEYYDRQEGL